MENPRLTFATPTVITGDQSLVSLIAHELAHSWSGNLVTFSSAKDAWLNEGFTSYVENRIIESLYGKERADMENVISRNELAAEFKEIDPKLQALALKPDALPDPDGSSSATVYTKGAWFLQFLEQRFGRDTFDAFLKGYFDHFAFQSIPTTTFVEYAKANLLAKNPGKVTEAELMAWIYEPGVPASAPKTLSPRFDAIDAARKAWLDAGTLPDKAATAKWTTQEWVHFIEGMPETLKTEQLAALDAAYRFTGTPNGEIAQRWYPLAVRSGYTQANEAIAAFLQKIGRRKLIMPTYEALVKTPEGLTARRSHVRQGQAGLSPDHDRFGRRGDRQGQGQAARRRSKRAAPQADRGGHPGDRRARRGSGRRDQPVPAGARAVRTPARGGRAGGRRGRRCRPSLGVRVLRRGARRRADRW